MLHLASRHDDPKRFSYHFSRFFEGCQGSHRHFFICEPLSILKEYAHSPRPPPAVRMVPLYTNRRGCQGAPANPTIPVNYSESPWQFLWFWYNSIIVNEQRISKWPTKNNPPPSRWPPSQCAPFAIPLWKRSIFLATMSPFQCGLVSARKSLVPKKCTAITLNRPNRYTIGWQSIHSWYNGSYEQTRLHPLHLQIWQAYQVRWAVDPRHVH